LRFADDGRRIPFQELAGPKPRFVNTLVIGVTPSEITIDRHRLMARSFRCWALA